MVTFELIPLNVNIESDAHLLTTMGIRFLIRLKLN
jgi:hypothetical protein